MTFHPVNVLINRAVGVVVVLFATVVFIDSVATLFGVGFPPKR